MNTETLIIIILLGLNALVFGGIAHLKWVIIDEAFQVAVYTCEGAVDQKEKEQSEPSPQLERRQSRRKL